MTEKTINMKHYLTIILSLMLSANIQAQNLIPDFSVDTVSGCTPVVIDFTNLSQPDTGISYYWDFGNGTYSTLKNPSSIYLNSGTYSVSLTISDSLHSQTITKENLIQVFGTPTANFSVSAEDGCLPFSVDFIDNSTYYDVPVNYWHWDFGDGTYSETQNTTHSFNNVGSNSISLFIRDENGCTNQIVEPNLISTHKPVADFIAENTFSCEKSMITTFTSTSTGDSIVSYFWKFGDGGSSKEENPSHNYSDSGSFYVNLIISDAYGCSDTVFKPDFVQNRYVVADFSASVNQPCENIPQTLVNSSFDADSYVWNFGDNSSSYEENPTHSFSDSGTYFVSLIARNKYGCADTVQKQVHINYVKANFKLLNDFVCQLPDTVQYINLSENAVSYQWLFGNGDTSFLENPENIITHVGIYSDTLIAYDKNGCSDRFVLDSGLSAQIPRAYFSPNNWVNPFDIMGCVPLTVKFYDNSIYSTDVDSIVSWNWDFGDNSLSTDINPTHTYTSLDVFPVYLTVTTARGCTSQYNAWAKTGTKQHASFHKLSPDTVCASQAVQFINDSQDDSLINYNYWIFGDSTYSTQQNPAHYFIDTGYMDVKLLTYNNGCPDDTLIENYVYVQGPYVSLTIEQNCENPYDVILNAEGIGIDDFYWTFGDNSPVDSVNLSPLHIYPHSDLYFATFYAKNDSTACSFVDSILLPVYDAKADFSMSDTNICVNDVVIFNSVSSSDFVPFSVDDEVCKFLWDFGDETGKVYANDTIISHKFKDNGDFNVKLIIMDYNSCFDTLEKTVHVHSPQPDFSSVEFSGCSPLSVQFNDNTSSYFGIQSYLWNFGNGQQSVEQNPSVLYSDAGNYTVSLTVTDTLNCVNTVNYENYIKVHKPNPNFWANKTNICSGDSVVFTIVNQIDTLLSILWDFGDGTFSNEINPVHEYDSSGIFDVVLTLVDVYNCDSTVVKNGYISVQKSPEPDFMADTTSGNCYPLFVNFADLTPPDEVNYRYWDFGNFTNSYLQNPSCTYLLPGNYTVTLTVRSSNGCEASISKQNYISVNGPYGQHQIPDTVCIYSENQFIASSLQNVQDVQWFFGEGGTSADTIASYLYSQTGTFYPILLLRSDDKNTCDKFFFDSVFVRSIDAGIFPDNGYRACVPFDFGAIDTTKNTFSRIWEINNQLIDTNLILNYEFDTAGVYDLSVFEVDRFGCKDTVNQKVTVFDLPKVKALKDTFVCVGSCLKLDADGAEKYSWYPATYLDNPDEKSPLSTPDEDIIYSVSGIDSNGCVNYDNVNIKVVQKPEFLVADTSLVIGDTIMLSNYSDDIATYTWSPEIAITCDTCASVLLSPQASTTYTLTITDTANCFELTKTFLVDVYLKYSIDVPTAFTPNGDGVNDKIYVDGWGIKDLEYFKIFNRFGEQVFSSTNLYEGWDGYYKGKLQPVDTYRYVAAVRSYDDKIRTKQGTIKLLK